MDFSLLSPSEFFEIRKMEMGEIINHLLCGWSQSAYSKKLPFPYNRDCSSHY